jgi:predicted outer membrane repeat protein
MFSLLPHFSRRHLRPGRTFRPRLEALEDRCVPATLFVSSSLDNVNQAGTLRYAVAHAQNGDVIAILPLATAPVGQHILLRYGELYLNHNVTIEAVGPQATIDGAQHSRVFEVAAGSQVTLLNLNIINGTGVANNPSGTTALDGNGGGILNEGTLTVNGCSLSNDVATNFGGGIFNDKGHLGVLSSTLSKDSARDGGAIATLGGQVVVSKSTLASNSAGIDGGALYNEGGTAVVNSCSLHNNKAGLDGGAIFSENGKLAVSNSGLFFNSALHGGGIYSHTNALALSANFFFLNVPDNVENI